MPEIALIGELLNYGMSGILLLMLWLLWRAYQVEVQEHREDLRKYVGEDKSGVSG